MYDFESWLSGTLPICWSLEFLRNCTVSAATALLALLSWVVEARRQIYITKDNYQVWPCMSAVHCFMCGPVLCKCQKTSKRCIKSHYDQCTDRRNGHSMTLFGSLVNFRMYFYLHMSPEDGRFCIFCDMRLLI